MTFDEQARTWDKPHRTLRARIIAEEIRKKIPASTGRGLDFGCGTGLIGMELRDLFDELVLFDTSNEMLAVVGEKAEKENASNITATSDWTNHGKYDFIYSSMVLHHIEDVKAQLALFHENLENDGIICIVDLDEDDGSFHLNYPDFDGHNGFRHEDLEEMLLASGYSDVEVKTFYRDEKHIGEVAREYSLFIATATKKPD